MSEDLSKKISEFVERVDHMKKQEKMDLSSDQDLTIAIMNLISIEEHFFFSGAKTGNNDYYDLIKDVREMRKELLKKIIKEYEGEVWCISKHLLAASMRLMEVGTKQLGMDKKEEAYELFEKAYNLYSLFWGINMKLLNIGDVKKIDDVSLDINDKDSSLVSQKLEASENTNKSFFGKLGGLIKKAIDCCIE